MGAPAARQDDQVTAVDTHIVLVPSGLTTVLSPFPHPFSGKLDGGLSGDVRIEGKPAATVDSTVTNSPSHTPTSPGLSFQNPPANKGTVKLGSPTVKINGRAAARLGDTVQTCNDPADAPVGKISSGASGVTIG